MTAPDTLADKLRTDLFAVLRSHEVSEQCFAEVAMITQAFKTRTAAPADVAEVEMSEIESLRHENECLHKTIEQIEYPCSPHCHGYLLELRQRDTITTQAARIAELETENFMLAAGACINPGQHALVGDEHGNSICTAYEALQTEEREHSEALARIAELEARVERMQLDLDAKDALQVSAYKTGAKEGWNMRDARDNDGIQRLLYGTEHIKELRRIKDARAALAQEMKT